ncbi:MAG: CotH kinase family protein, partial [Gemmataceae bacterium]
MKRWLFLATIPAGLLLPLLLRGDAAKDSDAFFAAGKVIRVAITIDDKNLGSLRREPRKYARATVVSGGKTYKGVGVHVKGAAGSWRGIDDRPGLTLNMDKFGVEQRFHGMDKWHLANSVQDPTWLQELVCGELFRAAGVPAARVAHAAARLLLPEGGVRQALPAAALRERGRELLRRRVPPRHRPAAPAADRTGGDVKDHADLKALVKACQERDEAERFRKI